MDGATICDPTAGQGVFALALFKIAHERNHDIKEGDLNRIHLIEIQRSNLDAFSELAKREYGVNYPKINMHCVDVITATPNVKFDILFGNPPWVNFADLPGDYKESLKDYFIREGLVKEKKSILLGSSRTDIAALILKISLGKLLCDFGSAYFFLPTSLFFGDDAHSGFRNYTANGKPFHVSEIYEFSQTRIFDKITTSYCCAKITLGKNQAFPVSVYRENNRIWTENKAVPFRNSDDAWNVFENGSVPATTRPYEIKLALSQQPRQGVNTCGANSTYIFDTYPDHIPAEYIYPLASNDLWKMRELIPTRWVFLPYNRTTFKPISIHEVDANPILRNYLADNKEKLVSRKGTLIQSSISKGFWWSLLGVGQYSFAPYKVIWQAYGSKDFSPIILEPSSGKPWQGNQAMHAFIPCWSLDDAKRIKSELQSPAIQLMLQNLNGSGKCNWAQPGKVKKILGINQRTEAQTTLFA